MDDTRETLDIVAIYGAIDRAVEADPDLASLISFTLPEYGEPGAHWYSAFETVNAEYVEREGGDPRGAIPSLGEALASLAGRRPLCRMRARRLLAVGSAARIFFDEDPSALQAAALGLEYLEGLEAEDASAERLVELFRRTPQAEDAEAALDLWWELLLQSGQVPDPQGIGPRPCSVRLVPVAIEGFSTPGTSVTTERETDDVTFARARNFTNPMNWKCFQYWCNMQDRGLHDGVHRYRETVSFACWSPLILKLVVDLDFVTTDEPGGVIAEYWLSDIQPEQRVLVNEGVLEVRQLGAQPDSGVRVKTTKRIKFAPPLDIPGFMLLLCRLGYLSLVDDLFCCAVDPDWNAPFPGREPVVAAAQQRMGGVDPGFRVDPAPRVHSGAQADPGAEGEPSVGCLAEATIDQVAAAAEDCVEGWAKDLKESYRKIGDESYTADALVQDVANMWVRMLGEAVTLADIGLRTAQMAPPSGRSERSGQQHSEDSTAGGKRSGFAKVIDDCSETAKTLIRSWSDYASDVSTNVTGTYSADTAAADFARAVTLAMKSTAQLTSQTMTAISACAGGPDRSKMLCSDEFSTGLSGATLTLKEELCSGRGYTLPNPVSIDPPKLGPGKTRFMLCVDPTDCRAGYYRGTVEASTPDGQKEEVNVRITVP